MLSKCAKPSVCYQIAARGASCTCLKQLHTLCDGPPSLNVSMQWLVLPAHVWQRRQRRRLVTIVATGLCCGSLASASGSASATKPTLQVVLPSWLLLLQLRFGRGPHGKPFLEHASAAAADQALAAQLEFNLAHTESFLGKPQLRMP